MRQPRSSFLKILLSSLILMLMVGDVAAKRGMGGGPRPNFYSNDQFTRQTQPYNYQARRQQQALQAQQQREYAAQQQTAMRQQRQFMEQRRQDMQRAMQQRQEQAALQRKIISDRQQQAQGSKNALLSQQKEKGQQIAAQFALKEQRRLKDRRERLSQLKQSRHLVADRQKKEDVKPPVAIALLSKSFQGGIVSKNSAMHVSDKPRATQQLTTQRKTSQIFAKKIQANTSKLFSRAQQAKGQVAQKAVALQRAIKNFIRCGLGGCSCSFHGETQVLTKDGFRPIKSLVVEEDYVWSRDEHTGDMDWKQVVAHYSNSYEETVTINIKNSQNSETQTIISNRIHPFFVLFDGGYQGVINGHWIEAQNLLPGDFLLSYDERILHVENISVKKEPILAYNISVKDHHTYFIRGANFYGTASALVHNDCPIDKDKNPDIIGAKGVATSSKTLWKRGEKERLDVENPSPGRRQGQIHYHDNKGNKYLFDIKSKSFINAPTSVNSLLQNSEFNKSIKRGIEKYLGESYGGDE